MRCLAHVASFTMVSAAAGADVPPPRPIEADVKLGCYYFPGHFNAAGGWSGAGEAIGRMMSAGGEPTGRPVRPYSATEAGA